MRAAAATIIVAALAVTALAQAPAGPTLRMYLIDVEGGNSTLIVSPAGESLLIDTANGGGVAGSPAAVRDSDRIMAAVRDAGVTQIDYLLTTHFHTDHMGAMAEFVGRIPVRRFLDHGTLVETGRADLVALMKMYSGLYEKIPRTIVKPGDRIAMKGLEVRIPTSAGEAIQMPLPGAGRANPYCAGFAPTAPDATENAQSVGTHITFGRFRTVHLGDLTINKEFALMCPSNRLGTVDLLFASHHGQAISSHQLLVHALEPRVILMNNGIRKGGQPEAMKVFHSAPGVEDIFQLHFSQLSGQEYTVPGMFIANLVDNPPAEMPIAPLVQGGRGAGAQAAPGAGGQTGRGAGDQAATGGGGQVAAPVHNGAAFWLKVTAREDGSFTVTNARNGFTKAYAARPAR